LPPGEGRAVAPAIEDDVHFGHLAGDFLDAGRAVQHIGDNAAHLGQRLAPIAIKGRNGHESPIDRPRIRSPDPHGRTGNCRLPRARLQTAVQDGQRHLIQHQPLIIDDRILLFMPRAQNGIDQ
jgi:hypothetical protein